MAVIGKRRVVFISFHDRVNMGLRILFAKVKQAGHEPYLVFVKDERAINLTEPIEDANQYQILSNDKFLGCGQDINPITLNEWNLLSSLLKDLAPEIVAVSSRSVHKELAFSAVEYIRKVVPNAVFLGGGYGPTIEPKQYLQHFDYICVGEADDVIVPFVSSSDFRTVPNIAYWVEDAVVYNQILPPCDLDNSTFPDWSDANKFMIEDGSIKGGEWFSPPKIYDILASRGCISSCTYCMACQWGKMLKPYGVAFPKVRLRSAKSVIDELLDAKEKYGITAVRFKDSILGYDEKWLFNFLDQYDKLIGLPFVCFLDVRYSSERVIKRLYESGLTHTTVGIQSADYTTRKNIFNRNIVDSKIRNYAHQLVQIDIQVKYELINWNPFEDRNALERGLDFLTTLPKACRINVLELKTFPGSVLEEKLIQEKPTQLSKEEYTFMAILQVMVLFSKTTEKLAFSLLKNEKHDWDWKNALRVFRNYLQKNHDEYKIAVNRKIAQGEQITENILSVQKNNDEQGISSDEIKKVIGLIAKNPMDTGQIIHWDDICYSYEATSTT